MTSVKESSKKRHLDGRIKLQIPEVNSFIDLTNDSDQESSASSKRAKSTTSGPGHKISLPYLSSRPSSTNNSQPRLTTPSNNVSGKKALFKSPPWQKNLPFPQQDGTRSPTATPTSRSFLTSYGSAVRASKDLSEIPENSRSKTSSSPLRSLSDAGDHTRRKRSHKHAKPGKNTPHRTHSNQEVSRRASHSALEKGESGDELLLLGTTRKPSNKSVSSKLQPESTVNSSVHQKPSKATKVDKGIKSKSASKSGTQTPSSESAYSKHEAVQTNGERKPPQITDTAPNKTPGRPRIVVEIPKSPSRILLEQFRKPLPRPAANAAQVITPKEARRNRAAELIAELKKDVSVACSRAPTVEAILGSHGLSEHYDDAVSIEAKHKALAQPKAKKVKRSEIKIDYGEVPRAAKVFNPVNIVPSAGQAGQLLEAKFEDISTGPLLTFFNDRNDKWIDGKFQFVDSYVHRDPPPKKAQATTPDFGCTCSDKCDPTDPTCRCSQTSGTKLVPYVKRPDGLVVLDPYFIDSFDGEPQEIFECNNACNCTQDCFNRVVQKGRTVPLQIFMTPKCGFGIRSPLPIKKGQFIDVYLGELLTTKQVEEYENASSEKSSSYIFSLDFFSSQPTYHVQGLHFGSPTRFINHSCNPNARTFTVMMNHADQKIYKLAYFAIKDIPAMKEITFDYSPKEEKGVRTPGEEEDEGVVRCLCGEKNCRGRLWASKRQAGRRGRGKGLARY